MRGEDYVKVALRAAGQRKLFVVSLPILCGCACLCPIDEWFSTNQNAVGEAVFLAFADLHFNGLRAVLHVGRIASVNDAPLSGRREIALTGQLFEEERAVRPRIRKVGILHLGRGAGSSSALQDVIFLFGAASSEGEPRARTRADQQSRIRLLSSRASRPRLSSPL